MTHRISLDPIRRDVIGDLLTARISRRQLIAGTAAVALAGGAGAGSGARRVAAQFDLSQVAFDDGPLLDLGYPAFDVEVTPDGIAAPAEVEEGWYLVTLSAPAPYAGYMDFMVPPAGLDEATMVEQASLAGNGDVTTEGWLFGGGTGTFQVDRPTRFATYLRPGDYRLAAMAFLPDEPTEAPLLLRPLTVTPAAGAGTPAATPAATPTAALDGIELPPVDVTLEMTDDLRSLVTPEPVPAGPRRWAFTNSGTTHSHHTVMWRCPDGTTAEALAAEYAGLFAGGEPAPDGLIARQVYTGYAALQSGGFVTLNGFDLLPGTSSLTCFIATGAEGVPHILDGMVTIFTVT